MIVKPGGVGRPAIVISARPAPLPPRRSFIVAVALGRRPRPRRRCSASSRGADGRSGARRSWPSGQAPRGRAPRASAAHLGSLRNCSRLYPWSRFSLGLRNGDAAAIAGPRAGPRGGHRRPVPSRRHDRSCRRSARHRRRVARLQRQPRPARGRDRVARLLLGPLRRRADAVRARPVHDDRRDGRRARSCSGRTRWRRRRSAPARTGYEFYVRLVQGGTFTPLLWRMPVGQKMRMIGPKGKFMLAPGDDRTHIFISSGTGNAPFVSMMKQALARRDAAPGDLPERRLVRRRARLPDAARGLGALRRVPGDLHPDGLAAERPARTPAGRAGPAGSR